MEYEIVKRKHRKRKRRNKEIVLVFSIIVAVIVVAVGLFGNSELKKSNSSKGNKDRIDNDITKVTDEGEKSSDEVNTNENASDENPTEDSSAETTQPSTDETSGSETTVAQEHNAVSDEIDPNKPMVALTFDDGPSSENTGRLLDALKENNAHATFFVVGYNVDGNEEILKRAVQEGNEIGNHTSNHSKLTSLDDAGLTSEIVNMRQKIADITGQSTVVIRPPYGAVDDHVMTFITDPVVLWSIDTEDWKTRNAAATVQNIQQNVYDGAIILMHDIHAESVDAAIQIIPWLREQGYQMVTMSELGYYRRGGLQTGIRYGALPPE